MTDLDAIWAKVEEYTQEIRELNRQRADLAAHRRTWLRAAVEQVGMDATAARLELTRGQLARLLNGTLI